MTEKQLSTRLPAAPPDGKLQFSGGITFAENRNGIGQSPTAAQIYVHADEGNGELDVHYPPQAMLFEAWYRDVLKGRCKLVYDAVANPAR